LDGCRQKGGSKFLAAAFIDKAPSRGPDPLWSLVSHSRGGAKPNLDWTAESATSDMAEAVHAPRTAHDIFSDNRQKGSKPASNRRFGMPVLVDTGILWGERTSITESSQSCPLLFSMKMREPLSRWFHVPGTICSTSRYGIKPGDRFSSPNSLFNGQ
jgi:hypothetical protein